MKRRLILIVLILLIITGCGKKIEVIQSNGYSQDKDQVEIINDYINIRKDKKIDSDSIGKVYKGEYYNIISYDDSSEYKWIEIETNNNIHGYISGEYSYVRYTNEDYYNLKPIDDNNQENNTTVPITTNTTSVVKTTKETTTTNKPKVIYTRSDADNMVNKLKAYLESKGVVYNSNYVGMEWNKAASISMCTEKSTCCFNVNNYNFDEYYNNSVKGIDALLATANKESKLYYYINVYEEYNHDLSGILGQYLISVYIKAE